MRYRDGAQLDPSQIGGGGSSGGGTRRGGVVVGGGLGGLVVVVILVLLLGPGVLTDMGGTTGQPPPQGGQPSLQECRTVDDIKTNRDCRYVAYTNSIQAYWQSALQGYQVATMVPFSGSVATACGQASSEVGPFYCPEDQRVYLDLEFLQILFNQLGADGGDAAEAYVIAHEYGHHVQNLTGVLAKAQQMGQQTGADAAQVRVELQADCYAGVWFAHATSDPNSPIAEISQDDIARAQSAAIAVGDDHIQQQSGGGVNPDAWTHGSSEQRKKWLMTGLQSGDPNACDTFSGNI